MDNLIKCCECLGFALFIGRNAVGFARYAAAPENNCWVTDLVFSVVPVRFNCTLAKLVIDRFFL